MAIGAKRNGKRPDGRRDLRKKATIRGRYMLQDGREFPCRTFDVSAGGIAIVSAIRGALGERVVLYLDQLGRMEGTIVRHFNGGFAIVLRASDVKRASLATTIERLT